MPKCAKGHEAGLELKCPSCGSDVSFRGSIQDLLDLPPLEVKFEEVAVLFIGPPPFPLSGVYSAEALVGHGREAPAKFVAERLEGGTWLDYNSRYSEQFKAWLRLVGFGKSRYRMVVLDTTSPLAVLAVNNIPLPDTTIVMASIPGANSTPVSQNASYAALQLARRRGMHLILALQSFIGRMATFTEGKGLFTGQKAYEEVIAYLLSSVGDLADMIQKDARLGVGTHYFSAVLSASDRVFKSVEGALEVQLAQTSLEGSPEKVITMHMFASSPPDKEREVAESFSRMASRDKRGLLNAESKVREKATGHEVYDALLLYGVKEPTVLDQLRAGYQTVASTASDLSLEGGLSTAPEAQPESAGEEEPEEPEEERKGPKQVVLMEDFVMARAETVTLHLQLRGDPREALLQYRAEVPPQKDPVEGLLSDYRDWLDGSFDEFASSISEEGGMKPEQVERLCAVAYAVSAVQDATFDHDQPKREKAENLLHELRVPQENLEGLSLVAASEALLKGAEPLFEEKKDQPAPQAK
jgi:hypothetical protein